jgi:hypothetical protein
MTVGAARRAFKCSTQHAAPLRVQWRAGDAGGNVLRGRLCGSIAHQRGQRATRWLRFSVVTSFNTNKKYCYGAARRRHGAGAADGCRAPGGPMDATQRVGGQTARGFFSVVCCVDVDHSQLLKLIVSVCEHFYDSTPRHCRPLCAPPEPCAHHWRPGGFALGIDPMNTYGGFAQHLMCAPSAHV